MTAPAPASGTTRKAAPARRRPTLSVSTRAKLWRARYAIVAVFLAFCTMPFLSARSTAAPAGYEVVVLTRDVSAGQPLRSTDLERTHTSLPPPSDAVVDVTSVTDATLAVNLTRGTPLNESMVSRSPFGILPPGYVVMPVGLANNDVAGLLAPGMTVDLLGIEPAGDGALEHAATTTVASRAVVMPSAGSSATGQSATGLPFDAAWEPNGSTVLLGMDPADALKVATATRWGPIHAIIVE